MTDATWRDAAPSELADALRTALLLDLEPVGVRFADESAAREEGGPVALPQEQLSRRAAPRPAEPLHYCAAILRAARGDTFQLTPADIRCDTATRILGFEEGFRDDGFIESYVSGGLYRDREVAEKMLAEVVVMRGTTQVIVGPLSRFDTLEPPHVAVVSTTPYGVMRLIQAAGFHGHTVRREPIGMHGICAECTVLPHVTGQMCVSLLCSGTRHVAGWDDGHISVGIPFPLLSDVVDGLVATAQRYETDERKSRIRSVCGCATSHPSVLVREMAGLEDGAGYFCEG